MPQSNGLATRDSPAVDIGLPMLGDPQAISLR